VNCKVFDFELAILHVLDGDELIPSKPNNTYGKD
jgi:hypothetical protein